MVCTMKIMHTMASEAPANLSRRRFYSPELKAEVTEECRQSGASVAGVALSHGVKANIVQRWLQEPAQSAPVPAPQVNGFAAVTLDDPVPGLALQLPLDIRVELRRANTTVVVTWPLKGAGACADWLREWLR